MPNLYELEQDEQTSEDIYTQMMNQLAQRAREQEEFQKQRARQLEAEINRSPQQRASDIYQEAFKSKYGFTPDKGAKRVLGGILDSVMGFVPGMGSIGLAAQKAGKEDYDNKVKGYEKLLSQELQNQKSQNQAEQFQLLQNLNKMKLETTQQKNQDSKDLKNKELEIKNKAVEGKLALDKLNGLLASTKIEEKLHGIKVQQELDKINPAFLQLNSIKDPQVRQMALGALLQNGQIKPDVVDMALSLTHDYKQANTPDKPDIMKVLTENKISQGENGLINETKVAKPVVIPGTGTKYQGPNWRSRVQQETEDRANSVNNPVAQKILYNNNKIPNSNTIPTVNKKLDLNKPEDIITDIETRPLAIESIGKSKGAEERVKISTKINQLHEGTKADWNNLINMDKKGDLDKFTGLVGGNPSYQSLAGLDKLPASQQLRNFFEKINNIEHVLSRYERGGIRSLKDYEEAYGLPKEEKGWFSGIKEAIKHGESKENIKQRAGLALLKVEQMKMFQTDPVRMEKLEKALNGKSADYAGEIEDAIKTGRTPSLMNAYKRAIAANSTGSDSKKSNSSKPKTGNKDLDKFLSETGQQD